MCVFTSYVVPSMRGRSHEVQKELEDGRVGVPVIQAARRTSHLQRRRQRAGLEQLQWRALEESARIHLIHQVFSVVEVKMFFPY